MITFTHLRFHDMDWKPGPGQTYRDDCPKARCKVTRMTKTWVYWTYANDPNNRGFMKMSREDWDRDYAHTAVTEETPGN